MNNRYSAENTQKLISMFDYDPIEGTFKWAINYRGRKAGDQAGSVKPDGYLYLKLYGIPYLAHRVAWMFVTGSWPEGQIDHKNMKRAVSMKAPTGKLAFAYQTIATLEARIAELESQQPAPVAVVLPTLDDFADTVENIWGFAPGQLCLLNGEDLKHMWLGCLDKVKELNK